MLAFLKECRHVTRCALWTKSTVRGVLLILSRAYFTRVSCSMPRSAMVFELKTVVTGYFVTPLLPRILPTTKVQKLKIASKSCNSHSHEPRKMPPPPYPCSVHVLIRHIRKTYWWPRRLVVVQNSTRLTHAPPIHFHPQPWAEVANKAGCCCATKFIQEPH